MSATHAGDDLLIVRTFDAPASLIFSLWSQPEHFRRWMGPKGFECAVADIDFRVGGSYRAMIRSPEQGDNWFGGTYRAIEPNRRIVFTFAWDGGPSAGVETTISIVLEEKDGRTTQIFHQAPFLSAERRDSHRGGWTSAFEKLAAYADAASREDAP
jgi:uncharacterized protein YndB with AHSA1/START domain